MTQITRKFITDNAINGTKIRLDNNELLRARNNANSTDISILRVNTSNQIEFQTVPYIEAGAAIPSAPKQLATIEYIWNYIQGKNDAKDAVNFLSDSNVTGTFSAGDAVTPATLIGTAQLTVDGTSFTGADVTTPFKRIALTGQTSGLENGVYDLTAAGASSFTLTRSPDFDGIYSSGAIEVSTGAYFPVVSGTLYSGYEVILVTADPITINTTALVFSKYPSTLSLIGGDMILKTNNTFSVDLATISGLESTNPGNDAGQLRIKVDTATLEKDRTTRIDTGSNALVAKKPRKLTVTLTGADITNQYLDLPFVASQDSVNFLVAGAGSQLENTDFTYNATGGSGSNTRLTFAGGLATGGVSALASTDVVQVLYESF